MKSLKESLLGNMEDTLEKGDEIMDKYECFGKRFEFEGGICGNQTATVLDALTLKRETKNMPYMNDYIERAQFDKQNKLKMLANFIDHIKLSDVDADVKDNPNSVEFRKNIGIKLKKYLIDAGVISKRDRFHIFAPSINATGPDSFELIICRTDKWGVNSMSKFRYKILY